MITVVISSYKYGHLAAHCIESLLSQTRKPDKILFVDDGVGDCKHLPYLYPQIEYIFREKNLGTVDNFQDMLMRVKTEYVMFLGADNWLRSDTIELLLNNLSDIVTYDIIVTGELKEEIVKRHPEQIKTYKGDFYWKRENMHHGSMLYKTSIGQKFGYKKNNELSKYTEEDWNLWNKMIEYGAKVSYVNEGLLFYRRHKENFLKY
jgi:glycosyltransferase involved in cell wall biosynthesis